MKKPKDIEFTRISIEDRETHPSQVEERLKNCPTAPGVYVMKDGQGHVIYVGKAKSLRSRVRSYFQNSADLSPKTQHLVSKVQDLEFVRTGSETEALLLENNLIKKWKPKYNIRLKDDKTYPYLKLDLKHAFPRPYIARRQVKGDGNLYFGPFPNSGQLRAALKAAGKVFQLRDCRDHDFANRSRPCLSYEVGQCTAPCVGKVSAAEYAGQVEDFKEFLSGENRSLEEKWEREMHEAAEALDFERAASLRDRLETVRAVVGQEQRMVDTIHLGDWDLWAVWPGGLFELRSEDRNPEVAEAEGDGDGENFLSVLVVQVRGGKWVGQFHRKADLSEGVGGENFLASLLLQHYGKYPVPEDIILPPGTPLPETQEFSAALKALSLAENLDEMPDPGLHFADEKGDWARVWELAEENAKALYEEQKAYSAQKEEGLKAIAKMLKLEKIPYHMECVDISNMQGEANVASCVVFKGGRPEKSEYRHYNIRGFEGQNDFASMKEVMSRRYGKPDSPVPDLLVIDGGKGQLASAVEILQALDCHFPVCALAKARTKRSFQSSELEASEERVFLPGQKNYIRFKSDEALRVMSHIRDEAHRFAIEFHRLKRSRARGL